MSEKIVEKIIMELQKNGSIFDSESLRKVKKVVEGEIKKDQSLNDSLKSTISELEEYTGEYLYTGDQVISGISSCIYLPNNKNNCSITMLGGKANYDQDAKEIDQKTVFDGASTTKPYTFLLVQELIKKGYFKESDKISDLDERFKDLGDYTVANALQMVGVLRTKGLVTDGKNAEEALQILGTAYVHDADFSSNNYTDVGFIILSKVMEKIVSEKDGRNLTFAQIMEKYLLKPWHLKETMFYPDQTAYTIAGNGNKEGFVHDPKARILGGAVGSAGLFMTSEGFKCLADQIFMPENVVYAIKMGTILFPSAKQCHRGYAGIYQKHPLGLDKTFVPNEYAIGSFATQGFTGPIAIFDPNNHIHNNILVSSIKDGEPKKPDQFMGKSDIYLAHMVESTLKAKLLCDYYETIGQDETIDIKVKVR